MRDVRSSRRMDCGGKGSACLGRAMSSGCSRDHPLWAHRGSRGACRRGRASSRHRQWRRPCHHRQRHCSARRMISSRAGRTWPQPSTAAVSAEMKRSPASTASARNHGRVIQCVPHAVQRATVHRRCGTVRSLEFETVPGLHCGTSCRSAPGTHESLSAQSGY